MRIYNTLTRQKEEFVPIHDNSPLIYACGPTVYNFIHIGNARPICVFDVLRRYLEYRGMDVTFVQNFTDIDDKIIRKANEEGEDYRQVSERYIAEYLTDAEGLGVKPATVHPKATENIDEILALIADLVDKGFAYAAEDGVYFRAKRFEQYGKLSKMPLEELSAGASERVDQSGQKEDPMDFALWKFAKPSEPFWPSPWGNGRPGWHIECSAMARRFLGCEIDIHCGGQDLIFPHHENEIAQSECANGCQFARFWMHNGYINVDNRKMSKSEGNFFTVREIAEQFGYEPIRYLMISAHYRSPINFSVDILKQCKAALERLHNCRDQLEFVRQNGPSGEIDAALQQTLLAHKDRFLEAMDDDLNTAGASGAVFEMIRDVNLCDLDVMTRQMADYAAQLIDELCDVLGIRALIKKDDLSEEVEQLIAQREAARKEKNWAEADRIRDKLKEMHIVLEDTKNGIRWKIEK